MGLQSNKPRENFLDSDSGVFNLSLWRERLMSWKDGDHRLLQEAHDENM